MWNKDGKMIFLLLQKDGGYAPNFGMKIASKMLV